MSENPKKNGGPYTKADQEQRRKKVYELYFEKGLSAVKIANNLGVNRNTVNEDVKYWMLQIGSQFAELEIGGYILKQIERTDIQRERLIEKLENAGAHEYLQIEKMLLHLESKINDFISKHSPLKIQKPEEPKTEIPKDKVIQILKDILFSNEVAGLESMSDNELLRAIITATNCEVQYARDILGEMEEMGLELFTDELSQEYDLVSFVRARDLLSSEEKDAFEKRILESEKNEQHE